MISWIVASHRPEVLEQHLLPSLPEDGELIVIRNAPSIAEAYAEGQRQATMPVRCYIHHDVQVLDADRLVRQLVAETRGRGIVGVIGSRTAAMPWWNGSPRGVLMDPRRQVMLNYGAGGSCAVVDGVLLATRQHVDWDTEYLGWHGYDHDACAQMRARGLENWCLDAGFELLIHHTTSPFALDESWDMAEQRYRMKWERV